MAKKTRAIAADTPVTSSPRFFSILIAGGFWTGKSTFIRTISEDSAMLDIYSGRVNLDDENALLLYELRSLNEYFFLPGEWLGMILILNSSHPEFLHEAANIYHTFIAYSGMKLPFIVVDNPHDFYGFLHNSTPESAWDVEALRWALKLDNDIPVIRCDVKNREHVKMALITLLEHFEKTFPAEVYNRLPFELVYTDSELFTAVRRAYWLCIVSTDSINSAEWFMHPLADEVIWLSSPLLRYPVRMGYCDLEAHTRLYLLPMKGFAFPTNPVQAAFDRMTADQQEPNFVAATFGCVGIIHTGFGERSLRQARELVADAGSLPLVLVDRRYRTSPPSTPDDHSDLAAAIPIDERIPVMLTDNFNQPMTYAVMRLLADVLPEDLAGLLKRKFVVENA
jgi:signal recognition particle receptor subunit beta